MESPPPRARLACKQFDRPNDPTTLKVTCLFNEGSANELRLGGPRRAAMIRTFQSGPSIAIRAAVGGRAQHDRASLPLWPYGTPTPHPTAEARSWATHRRRSHHDGRPVAGN